jgi:hypothetical protein
MNRDRTAWSRRDVLLTSLAGSIAGAALSASPAAAQQKASLIAKRVDRVPDNPDDGLWQTADVLEVPMAPQAVVKPRTYEASVKIIKAHALYDADQIAFRLQWADPRSDTRIDGAASFRDAVAVEFPANPANGIPYFAMGEANKPVTIYQWKADWQFARYQDVGDSFPGMAVDEYPFSGRRPNEIAGLADYGNQSADKLFHTSWSVGNALGDPQLQARTPVEKLAAEGFGTVTSVESEGQDASGVGVWKDGVWTVLISLPRQQEQFAFRPEQTVPLAFAAWDGTKNERGGEKAISTWYFLSLDEPLGTIAYTGPLLAVAAVAALQAWGLRLLRRKARLEMEMDS